MRASAVALLLAAVLAGCGSSGAGSGGGTTNGEAAKPAATVLSDAVHAAKQASSFHVSGHVVSGKTPVTLDLTLVRGKGAKGSLTENGLGFDLVRVGDKLYVHGSDAFWRHYIGSAAAILLHGRWIEGSATHGRLAQLQPLTSPDKLFALVESSHGKLVNAGATTYDGRQVDEIRNVSDGSKLYVSTTGTPYPVALVGGGAHAADQLRFDRWNAQVSLTPPAHAIDVSQFG